MKKTLLLSVVASTMIMAGGDIAPVEPVVAPVAVSAWDFSGQAVVYYQTNETVFTNPEVVGGYDLFNQGSSQANAGVQLRAVNADVFAGIGAGVEVSGLATLGLEDDVVSDVMQGVKGDINGGWISQAYLTYGIANTSLKLGRQELPESLSPFAHSENWNVFTNTYDAALIVNTDISDTTLVGAWVKAANQNGYGVLGSDMATFTDVNDVNGENGIYMLTAQNKSIEGLTLTGSWYYGSEFLTIDDLNILWGDAKFNISDYTIAVQGGSVMHDAIEDTKAFGAMAGAKFGMFDASLAYSNVNDSTFGVFNIGGQQTVLYTQMVINEHAIANDNDTFVVRAGAEALGGKFGAAYGMTTDNSSDNADYNEFDLTYTTTVFESVDLTAAYVNMDLDVAGEDANNLVRVIGRYNF